MLEIPKILYHATLKDNVLPIMTMGMDKAYDGIYFCDNSRDSAKFLVFKAMALRQNIAVLKIKTEHLDKSLFTEGTDHNVNFYDNPNVFVYHDNIAPEYILHNYDDYDINDIMGKG